MLNESFRQFAFNHRLVLYWKNIPVSPIEVEITSNQEEKTEPVIAGLPVKKLKKSFRVCNKTIVNDQLS